MSCISLNFNHLQKLEKLTKDEFGYKYGLKKNVFANYIRNNKCNNADFLIKLSEEYNISVKDLVTTDITKSMVNIVHEPGTIYEKKQKISETEILKSEIKLLKQKLANKDLQIDILESQQTQTKLELRLEKLEKLIEKIA